MKSFLRVGAAALTAVLASAGCLPRSVTFVPVDSGTDIGPGPEGGTDGGTDDTPDVVTPVDTFIVPTTNPRCTRTFPDNLLSTPEIFNQHLVIGSIFSYTDNLDTLQAAELAVRQADGMAGLQSRPIGIVHCDYTANAGGDGMTDVQATTAITNYLAGALRVPAIIGPRGSPRAIAALAALQAMGGGTVLISPSASSTALRAQDNPAPTDAMPGFFWRTVPPDTLQARAAANDLFMHEHRLNVAMIYDNGSYGMTFADSFSQQYVAMGGTMPTRFSFTPASMGNPGTLPAAIASVAMGSFDAVLFLSSNLSDHASFLSTIGGDPMLVTYYSASSRTVFFSAVGYSNTLLTSPTPEVAMVLPRIRGARPAPATGSSLLDAFESEYMGQYGTAPDLSAFAVNSYDASWLVMYGAAWSLFNEPSMSVTGLGISRGLRHMSSGTTSDIRPSNWFTVQNSFRMHMNIDVSGASGALNFDSATNETTAPIEVWRVDASGTPAVFASDYTLNY